MGVIENEKRTNKKSVQVIAIILFFLIGATIFILEDGIIRILTSMMIMGAFGGLLYSARNYGLEFIHANENSKFKAELGWLSDAAFGIAGALVIFLLVPPNFKEDITKGKDLFIQANLEEIIRFLALSLLGGYGGRGFVHRALSNVVQKVEEVAESTQEIKKDIAQKKKQDDIDESSLELILMQLDVTEQEQNSTELKDAIKQSSKNARYQILKEARRARKDSGSVDLIGKETPLESDELLRRTIPIFEALIENDSAEKYHRNHGQLGYALWELGLRYATEKDLERVYKEMSIAIKIRDNNGSKGFLFYELVRALSAIELGLPSDIIEKDIKRIAAKNPQILSNIHEKQLNQIKNWATNNNVDYTKISE